MAGNNGKINYNDIVDQAAIDQLIATKNEIKALWEAYKQLQSSVKDGGIKIINASGVTETESAMKKQREQLSELDKIKKQLITTQEKLTASESLYAQALAEEKMSLQDSTAATKNFIKERQAASGSVDQMEAKLVRLRKEFNALSESMRLGGNGQKLLADIQKLDSAVKMAKFSTGDFTKNVGNYQSATFQLTQVLRELPAFASSTQTGIMGISNNLPILADAFRKVKAETGSAWQAIKVFGSSLFSFGNIFAVGVGLLTIYSDKLFAATKSTNELKDAHISLSEAIMEGNKNAGEEVAKLDIVYNRTQNVKLSIDQRRQAVEELQKDFPAYFKNIGTETILNGGAIDSYNELREAIMDNAKAKAISATLAERYAQQLQNEEEIKKRIATAEAGTTREGAAKVYSTESAQNESMRLARRWLDREKAALKESQDNFRKSNEILLAEQANYYQKSRKLREQNAASAVGGKAIGGGHDNIGKGTHDQRQAEIEDYTGQLNELDREVQQMNEKTDAATIDRIKKRLEKIKELNEQYAKMEIDLWKENAEAQLRDWDRVDAERMASYERSAKAIQISTDLLETIADAQYNAEIRRINNKSEALENSYKLEKQQIEGRGLTQQQKAKELANLEARTEAQRKIYEKDRITADRKRAQLQKGFDIANIVTTTALAIVKALSEGDPYTKAARAGLAAATGAASLAKAVATPIPQYAKGTDNHPGGLAEVGERGIELGVLPSGQKFLTPGSSTIMDLPAKTKIIPHEILMQELYNTALVKMATGRSVTTDTMQAALIETFEENTEELRLLRKEMKSKKSNVSIYGNFDHYTKIRQSIS